MKDPITVAGSEETNPEVSDALEISNLDFTIERDYEQSCMLTVENVSSTAKEFYLEVTNNYADLSMEIIKNGSKDDPTFVAAGQSVEVELSVFAQNAENENYIIPVTAYVLSASGEYEEAFTDTIDLTCKLPSLDLSWELMQSNDSTLKQVYKVSNEGETLTDLTITASDELKDYLNFSPFVTNYQLDANDDVQFEVWPDLAKMKNNNVSKLSGQLIASCAGKTSTYDCTFDTKGQEITITTMGKLAQQQDGNPFIKFEIAEDSVTLNYGDGTAVTEDTNIDDILDENGMSDLSSTMDLDLGVENNFPVEISMNSTQVSEEDAAQYENKTEIIESEENNSITMQKIEEIAKDPTHPAQAAKKIKEAIEEYRSKKEIKTVTIVLLDKDQEEVAFKIEADTLIRNMIRGFDHWSLADSKSKQLFADRMADPKGYYYAKDIIRVTFGKNVLYERNDDK